MNEKRKVLGRGLETLLPPRHLPHVPATVISHSAPSGPPGEGFQLLRLSLIDHNPYQTRGSATMNPASISELVESIRVMGVVEPIVVRPTGNGRYHVIAGERRCGACRTLQLETIPAIVRVVSDQQAAEMTIVENLQRLDLTPIEEARGYDRLSREFGLTQEQMALRTGKERSTVTNLLRLLRLPNSVQVMIDTGRLSLGHAKALMALDSPDAIEKMAKRAIANSLSVRQTEVAVTNLVQPLEAIGNVRIVDPNVKEAEQELQRALGVRVTITDRNGRGKILLEYHSLEDFDRILEVMKAK